MSTGAVQSGCARVVLAVNHWRTAIATHQTNHPDTRHICAEMEHIDPLNDGSLPDIDLLMAGVECTHHSNAKGGAPVSDQRRSSGRHVLDWARAKRPKWIVVENVREFRDWGPTRLKLDANGNRIWDRRHRQWAREADPARKGEYFRAWIAALKRIGYRVEHRLLNSADYGEAQKRVRLFVIARLGKGPIAWPDPTHAQIANGKPRWREAAEIIDWRKPAPSIFGRKRPLAAKTLRRIEIGLWRFCAPKTVSEAVARSGCDSFLVKLRGTGLVNDCHEPLPTLTAGGTHLGVARPFVVKYHAGDERKWAKAQSSVSSPLPTIDTQPRFGLVQPFLFGVDHRSSDGAPRLACQPMTTITGKQRHCLVEPFLLQAQGPGWGDPSYAGVHSVREPMRTVLTRNNHAVVCPFLVPHFGERNGQVPRTHGLGDPLPTVTGQGAGSLVQPFLLPRQGFYDAHQLRPSRSIYEPLNTITAHDSAAHLVMPYLVEINHGEGNRSPGGRVHSVNGPLGTVTTHRAHGLILPEPFLVKYYGTAVGQTIDAPLSTVTTKPRHGLALFGEAEPARTIVVLNQDEARLWRTMDLLGIADIGFRMLDVDELAAAMGLPAEYYLHGNKEEQIKQIGNMVCVGVMRAICRAIGQAV